MSDTRVIFNGQCPICSREVRSYARYSETRSLPLTFEALDEVDLARLGLDERAAMRRLHVVHDGQLHAGVDAFLILWSEMPRFRPLARVIRLPVIRPLAEVVYERGLAPLLYAWNLRRRKRALAEES